MPVNRARKGKRVERDVASFFEGMVFVSSFRIPGSGNRDGLPGDIRVRIADGSRVLSWGGECKARKDGAGFKTLDRWLGGMDFLILKEDRKVARVTMTLPVLREMLEAAYGAGQNVEER